nr:uncharacterized protein c3h8.04 [Quercus suber]
MAIYNEPSDAPYLWHSSPDAARPGEDEQRGDITPVNDQESPTAMFNPYFTGRPRTPASANKNPYLNRQELIRRIKSRESRPSSPEVERQELWAERFMTPTDSLQASVHQRPQSPDSTSDQHSAGLQIERPRSALHRGDFRERKTDPHAAGLGDGAEDDSSAALSTSPVVPWHPEFPAAVLRQARLDRQERYLPSAPPGLAFERPNRSRAASQASLSTSFVYKPPTSPLVQSSRPDTPEPGKQRSRSPDRSRRHTFSPHSVARFQSALDYPSSARQARPPATLRAERSFPYQAHQPRRSLHSFGSLPHSPSAHGRRPSLSDSPLHHAPMVGSYEESILRGRMSTTPSRPLNFVAQIGVLGRGDCKANLRCPPHAVVPFPAVFYSYAGTKSTPADQPSPYVGLVDLENNLPNPDGANDKRRRRLQAARSHEGSRASSRTREDVSASEVATQYRRRHKQKRRSGSPKAPPGGSYRLPQQGQIQIIIKNPNKTAVKLFLIPYDLSDMEPGQKTFIRQRSYSAGPIIDMPLSSRKNLGTDRPEAALSASDDPNERPMLRYLIHLHICCPSKGRYFLYKSVRVVFANRVPDGKEKLRNEVQLPEPKYTAYKVARDANTIPPPPQDPSRRRSHLVSHVSVGTPWLDTDSRTLAQSLPSSEFLTHFPSLPPDALPHHLHHDTPSRRRRRHETGDHMEDIEYSDTRSQESNSTRSPFSSPPPPLAAAANKLFSPVTSLRTLEEAFEFDRERRGPGRSSGESLLSRRLKDLALPPPSPASPPSS